MQSLDDVITRYQDYGSQTQAPLPPPALATSAHPVGVPQYVVPNAFQTPAGSVAMYQPMSPQNAYDAQVSQRFAGQSAMYSDPNAAAGNMSGRAGRNVGESVGGTIGGIAGSIAGAFSPVAPGWGSFLGGVAGGAAGDAMGGGIGAGIGRIGGAVGSWFSDTRENQAQHMSMATNIQQGTQGHLMLGAGESGLGGSGMNLQSAGKLAQRLSGAGKEEGMSNQDMTSLTRAAGELNFLDNATNTDQIFETVKKLTKVVGVMGKLTGDPDIMRNLKEIANLRAVGLNIDQAVQATEQIDMAARGMGMDRFQAMSSAGAAGSSLFRGAGMTGGVGMVQGVGAGAMARMGAGGLDERQLALAGGVPGLTNTFMQQNARFAQGAGNMMMLSGISQGANGEFGMQSDFGEQLQGKGSFGGRVKAGLGNVKTPGQLVQFLGQQRELQTEMMEQLGPFGAQLGQARLIEDMAKQMGGATQRESVLMAASMVTGSPEEGLKLMRTLGSSQFREKAEGFIDEEIKRTRFKGKREAATQRKTRDDARTQRKRKKSMGDGALGWMAEAVGYIDEDEEDTTTIGELAEAEQEELEAQDEAADEAFEEQTGLKRKTKRAKASVVARPVERERKRAEKMRKAGWKLAGLSESGQELGGVGVSLDYDEETKQIRVKGGAATGEQKLLGSEETAADIFMGEEALSAGWTGGFFTSSKEIKTQRQGALKKLRKTNKRINEAGRAKEKSWHRGLKNMVEKLGAGETAAMEQAAIKYAKSLDETGDGIDSDVMFEKMVKAFADTKGISHDEARSMLQKDKAGLERAGIKFVEESGDPVALSALERTKDAGATDVSGMSADAIESFRDDADKRMTDVMSELGFAEKDAEVGDASPAQQEAFDTFRGLSGEDQAMALGILAKEGGTASKETQAELVRLRAKDPDKYKKVQEAAQKMSGGLDSEGKKRLATKAGRTTSAFGMKDLASSLTEGAEAGRGKYRDLSAATDLANVEAEMKSRGQGDTEESGEGAAAGTTASRAKEAALNKQKDVLQSLPEILGEFPDAVKSLKGAADKMSEAFEKAGVGGDSPQPKSWW